MSLLYKMLMFLPYVKHCLTYQNKAKVPEKNKKRLVAYKKRQIISAIYKLFQYNFWWKCLEFINQMYLTIQMRISSSVKHNNATCLRSGDFLLF